MTTALIEAISIIAPGVAQTVQQLQEAKLNNNQIMISLLALNLESLKKIEGLCQQIRDLRGDMARKGTI
jgi:hypothetical protein